MFIVSLTETTINTYLELEGFYMKRKGNIYQNIYKMDNIVKAYNDVCRNTKNKRKVERFREYRCIYISRIHNILKNKEYVPRTI